MDAAPILGEIIGPDLFIVLAVELVNSALSSECMPRLAGIHGLA